jgi:hypothetical protein
LTLSFLLVFWFFGFFFLFVCFVFFFFFFFFFSLTKWQNCCLVFNIKQNIVQYGTCSVKCISDDSNIFCIPPPSLWYEEFFRVKSKFYTVSIAPHSIAHLTRNLIGNAMTPGSIPDCIAHVVLKWIWKVLLQIDGWQTGEHKNASLELSAEVS